MKRALFLLACALSLSAQVMLPSYQGAQVHRAADGGFTLLDHTRAGSGGGTGNVTSPTMNCPGPSLVYVMIGQITTINGITVTDSAGNTYLDSTPLDGGLNGIAGIMKYAYNPVGSSSLAVTVNGSYQGFETGCFSGNATSSALDKFDKVSTASGGATTSPTLTPTQNGELILVGWAINGSGPTVTLTNGFTLIDNLPGVGGHYVGAGVGYLVQATAGAINTVVTNGNGDNNQVVAMMTFKHP